MEMLYSERGGKTSFELQYTKLLLGKEIDLGGEATTEFGIAIKNKMQS